MQQYAPKRVQAISCETATTETIDRRERRRRAILDAARALFLEHGYDAVSLGQIVRVSGGSLSTVYEHFESKAGLLAAILTDHRFEGLGRLEAMLAADHSPRDILVALMRAINSQFGNRDMILLTRLVMEEMRRDPVFAQRIFSSAHLPIMHRMARLFAKWTEQGRADITDPDLAVLNFFSLMGHRPLCRTVFGEECEALLPSEEAEMDSALDLFVRGYAIR